MTEKGLAKWLYKHCYDADNNVINLYNLDFSPYKCNVTISGMKVDGKLYQCYQTAKKIYQTKLRTNEIIMDNINNFEVNTDSDYTTLTQTVKKITKEEIEKELGYKINIID